MRIWSIHPKYLDTKGMVAFWRETLLAKNVLEGNTKGYTNHPQLIQFKAHSQPIEAIHFYLSKIYDEAILRTYRFDESKFVCPENIQLIPVIDQQLKYEWQHLLNKLSIRDPKRYEDFYLFVRLMFIHFFILFQVQLNPWKLFQNRKR